MNLLPVEAAAELRPGLALYERDCHGCLRSHWMTLVALDPGEVVCGDHRDQGAVCPLATSWRTVGCCGEVICLARSLREGRLFRLPEEPVQVIMGELEKA